jgi:hypothetical protein
MKFLLLVLLSLSTYANDGLLKIPENAVLNTLPATGLIFADDQTAEVYANQVLEKIKKLKKSVLATRARDTRPSREVGCLNFPGAYGFEQVSDTEYKVNCFAGNERNLTHVLDYHFRLVFMPATCTSEQSVRDYFKIPNNRTKARAEQFLAEIEGYCSVMAVPADPANPIVQNRILEANYVNELLEQKEDLRVYVNGSRAKKQGSAGSDGQKYTNPLRNGTSAE